MQIRGFVLSHHVRGNRGKQLLSQPQQDHAWPLSAEELCLCSVQVGFDSNADSNTRLSFQVHLQTQQEVKKRMVGMAIHVVKTDGVLALYNGLSASLCRQVRVCDQA